MIEPSWHRISGLHVEPSGTVGVVWLAHDRLASVVHLYDAALFNSEVFAVIAAGIAARGRRFPIAWRKQDKEFAEKLMESGLNVLPEHCADNQSLAEVISREIWQRLRTSQFRVEKRVGEWLQEYRNFYRNESKVPLEGFPLMAATRHAIEMLDWAQPESFGKSKRSCAPELRPV